MSQPKDITQLGAPTPEDLDPQPPFEETKPDPRRAPREPRKQPTSVEIDWHEMSDPEVMARLLRRGIEPVTAKGWVRDREQPWADEEIGECLTATYLDANDEPIKFEHNIDRRVKR